MGGGVAVTGTDDVAALFARVPREAWLAGAAPALLALLALAARGTAAQDGAWRVLRPTFGLYLMALAAVCMSGLFVAYEGRLLLGLQAAAVQTFPIRELVMLAASPFLSAGFLYAAASILFVRVRFGEAGVEKRWFGRRRLTA